MKLQKSRWFKAGQKWRTGCEGGISVLKAQAWIEPLPLSRHGRHAALGWLGVIADNLLNVGRQWCPRSYDRGVIRRWRAAPKQSLKARPFESQPKQALTIGYFASESS